MTAFLYVNDDYEGGATVFPVLNISIQPKKVKKKPHPLTKMRTQSQRTY